MSLADDTCKCPACTSQDAEVRPQPTATVISLREVREYRAFKTLLSAAMPVSEPLYLSE